MLTVEPVGRIGQVLQPVLLFIRELLRQRGGQGQVIGGLNSLDDEVAGSGKGRVGAALGDAANGADRGVSHQRVSHGQATGRDEMGRPSVLAAVEQVIGGDFERRGLCVRENLEKFRFGVGRVVPKTVDGRVGFCRRVCKNGIANPQFVHSFSDGGSIVITGVAHRDLHVTRKAKPPPRIRFDKRGRGWIGKVKRVLGVPVNAAFHVIVGIDNRHISGTETTGGNFERPRDIRFQTVVAVRDSLGAIEFFVAGRGRLSREAGCDKNSILLVGAGNAHQSSAQRSARADRNGRDSVLGARHERNRGQQIGVGLSVDLQGALALREGPSSGTPRFRAELVTAISGLGSEENILSMRHT